MTTESKPFPFTPEQVKAAYDRTGLTPIQGRFWHERLSWPSIVECSCGLTAIIADKVGKVEASTNLDALHSSDFRHAFIEKVLGIDENTAESFMTGFDNYDFGEANSDYPTTNREAYTCGRESAILMGLIKTGEEK